MAGLELQCSEVQNDKKHNSIVNLYYPIKPVVCYKAFLLQ